MKDNQMMTNITDYQIDLDKFTLTTKNLNMDSTYRLIIYVNTLYINDLNISINKFIEEK
jgi:hypothetical protein